MSATPGTNVNGTMPTQQTGNQLRTSQPSHKQGHSSGSSSSHTSTIVGSHYKIGKKIGEGSFGVIYEGISQHYQSFSSDQIVKA